jgi:hypothetical protein
MQSGPASSIVSRLPRPNCAVHDAHAQGLIVAMTSSSDERGSVFTTRFHHMVLRVGEASSGQPADRHLVIVAIRQLSRL